MPSIPYGASVAADLVVAEHHAAHQTLLLLPGVGDPPAAGFGHHVIWMEDPEEAVLEVLRAVHPTAFKLLKGTREKGRKEGEEEERDSKKLDLAFLFLSHHKATASL